MVTITDSPAVGAAQATGDMLALTVRVPVHTMAPAGDVLEVPVVVHHVDPDTTEVLIDGEVVGYIRSDGRHFVALSGPRLEDATQCGRLTDLWDHAIARLYTAHLR